jgi:hypothetical protein
MKLDKEITRNKIFSHIKRSVKLELEFSLGGQSSRQGVIIFYTIPRKIFGPFSLLSNW